MCYCLAVDNLSPAKASLAEPAFPDISSTPRFVSGLRQFNQTSRVVAVDSFTADWFGK